MLIHCPTCATSYEVKPNSLGAAGRSVRCVRCRTVWFASARPLEPIAATGQRASAVHPDPNAAPGPVTPRAVDAGDGGEPTPNEGELQAPAAMAQEAAADEFAAAEAPLLDPGAQALAMDTIPPPSLPVDTYEPIAMADAPPLAPMDLDASTIPPEPPMLTGVANRVDVFVAQRAGRSALPAERVFPMPSLPVLIATLAAVVVGLLIWRASVVFAMPQTASLYATIGLPVNLRGLVFEEVNTAQETQDGVQVLVVEGSIANVARSATEVPRLRFALLNANGGEVYSWTSLPSRSVLASGEKLPFRTRLASPPSDGREVNVRFFNRRDATGGSH